MPKGATIVSGALTGLQNLLSGDGLVPADLGRKSGIPAGAWRNPEVEVPLTAFVQMYEQGSMVLDRPGIGWQTGPLLNLADLGDLGRAILSAPTVGAALRTFVRFLQFVQSETDMRLDVEGGVATLSYRILNPDIWPRRQDAEFTLSVLRELIARGAGAGFKPDFICFEHAPARPLGHWCETTGVDCLFECETNSLSFPERILDCPLPRDPLPRDGATGHRTVLEDLTRRLINRNRARSVTGRARTAIYAGLGGQDVDQESIARQLGLSRRSLHRHLGEEGIRFSALLDDCRFRVARHALVDTSHPLAQIAFELNYSDQTAFERAFKRRTGMTPRQYRRMTRRPKGS